MRFLLYDKVVTLKKGVSIRGVKGVTLTEDAFCAPFASARYLPEPLIIEALAQIAGWLINVSLDFKRSSLMSMVRDARFQRRARAGDQLVLDAEIVRVDADVARARARATADTETVASIEEIVFILLPLNAAQIVAEKRKFAYFSGNYPTEAP